MRGFKRDTAAEGKSLEAILWPWGETIHWLKKDEHMTGLLAQE